MPNVPMHTAIHERVTERIRPRITVGASRDNWGEGRVVEER